MVFDTPTRTRLLGSIEANRLVLLCGAGLSIPQPGGCQQRKLLRLVMTGAADSGFASADADNIEQLATHFYGTASSPACSWEPSYLGTSLSDSQIRDMQLRPTFWFAEPPRRFYRPTLIR